MKLFIKTYSTHRYSLNARNSSQADRKGAYNLRSK